MQQMLPTYQRYWYAKAAWRMPITTNQHARAFASVSTALLRYRKIVPSYTVSPVKFATRMSDQQPVPATPKQTAITLVIIALVVFVLFKACTGCGGDENEKRMPTEVDALLNSRTFVERSLKAPSTAEFASSGESTVVKINDSTFTVLSYVDAQNSFGGMMRSKYSCQITFMPGAQVEVDNLVIE
jgi:hypothetical protein